MAYISAQSCTATRRARVVSALIALEYISAEPFGGNGVGVRFEGRRDERREARVYWLVCGGDIYTYIYMGEKPEGETVGISRGRAPEEAVDRGAYFEVTVD